MQMWLLTQISGVHHGLPIYPPIICRSPHLLSEELHKAFSYLLPLGLPWGVRLRRHFLPQERKYLPYLLKFLLGNCVSQICSLPGKSAWIRDGQKTAAPPGAQCYFVGIANQKRSSTCRFLLRYQFGNRGWPMSQCTENLPVAVETAPQ